MKFYVYCLFRPDGSPCYVGKGSGNRAHAGAAHRPDNPHLQRIFAKAGGQLPTVILHEGLSESVAFEYERALIAAIGREPHGPLVNLTDGGEGSSGHSWSAEAKARKAAEVAGWWKDPVYRHKMSQVNIGNTWNIGRTPSPESRDRHSALMRGNSHARGRKNTPEQAIAERERRSQPEFKSRISAKIKALWDDPAYRAQQLASRAASEAYRDRAKSPKVRAYHAQRKMAASS